MPKRFSCLRIYSIFWLILIACGVNTGNPSNKFRSSPPVQHGSSLSLYIEPLSLGTLQMRLKSLALVPTGESLGSDKVVNLALAGPSYISSGQAATIITNVKAPAGDYDRILLVLDPAVVPTLTDASQNEQKIAFAPYKYYDKSQTGEVSNNVQIVLSLTDRGMVVEKEKRQTYALRTDLQSAIINFDAISADVRTYFQSLGDLEYTYSFTPATSASVLVKELNSGPGSSGTSSSSENFASIVLYSNDASIRYLTFCVYEGKVDVPTDTNCRKAYQISTSSPEVSEDGKKYYYFASFELPPATYTLLAKRDDAYTIVYITSIDLLNKKDVRIEEAIP